MCSNFFQTEQISPSLAALDEALALPGCPGVHRTKWSYWFSVFFCFLGGGGGKNCELIEMGTTPYLTINKVSSTNLC